MGMVQEPNPNPSKFRGIRNYTLLITTNDDTNNNNSKKQNYYYCREINENYNNYHHHHHPQEQGIDNGKISPPFQQCFTRDGADGGAAPTNNDNNDNNTILKDMYYANIMKSQRLNKNIVENAI